MGHRTLVAYEREPDDDSDADGDGGSDADDAVYDLHLAHWGVDPGDLTPETPFGGSADAGWARRRASELLDPAGGRLVDGPATAVDPDPIATGVTFVEACACIDPLSHEALYIVGPDFAVRMYLVFALRSAPGSLDGGGCGSEPDGPIGGLVGYEDELDAAYLRGWLAGARAVRDVAGLGDEAVVRALRWLDPDRGTLVFLVDA